MQPKRDWITGLLAWDEFVAHHPELGYKPGKWAFYNFLRFYREGLIKRDAIRLAKRRLWIAHRERFMRACFDLATGAADATGHADVDHKPAGLGRRSTWYDVILGGYE